MTAPVWLSDFAERVAKCESVSLHRGLGVWSHRLNVKDRALLTQAIRRGMHEIFDETRENAHGKSSQR